MSEFLNSVGEDVALMKNPPPSEIAVLFSNVLFSTETVAIINKSTAPPLSAVLL